MNKRRPQDTHFRPERQLNAKLLPLLVILFAALYALTGYRGWLAFLVGFGGAWLLGAVWIRIIEQNLSVVRKIDFAWAHVGESVPEQFLITNKSRLPVVWIEVIDESDRLTEPVRLVTDIEPKITRRRTLNHSFKQRGIYRLGPTRLCTSDPLGIYTMTMRDLRVNTILVTPPQLPLAQLHIPPGGQADNKHHNNLQALTRLVSAAGVRDYSPGDSLRRIHWHASAHRGTLMVRQLEAAASEDWWVFADLDSSVQAGSGLYSTLELVIVLAASLVARGLKEHHRVGLTLAGPKLVWMEPRSGSAQRWNLLCALAAASPGDRSLDDLFTLGRPIRTGSLIVITPTRDPLWVTSVREFLPAGSMKVLLVNPMEFGQSIDQGRVSALLSKCSIPYSIMSRTLLEEAYSSSGLGYHKRSSGIEARKRFMEKGRSNWQSID